jgi:hypothetical protein
MKHSILFAALLALTAVFAASPAPVSPSVAVAQPAAELVPAGYDGNWHNKKGYKHFEKHYDDHHGKYWYKNRYWAHRYNYRPHDWETIGCVAVGPVWYCP